MGKAFIKITFTALLLFTFCSQKSWAQLEATRLDSLFTARFKNSEFNGNVLIAKNRDIIYQQSFGYADRENKILNDKASRFHLASTSKLFTAVAILQLKEKGLLKLSDPVVKFIPDFPFRNVKIWHLLTHTSGLPDFQIFESYYREDPKRILTNADIIPALKKYGDLLFEPGARWSYSSPGMALLADITEVITHMKFERYLKKNIWEVSGMHHTYINSLSATVTDPKRVKNYARATIFSDSVENSELIPQNVEFAHISGAVIGPGLVVSDCNDLYLFDKALYAGKLLKQATMDEAFTPIKLNDGSEAQPDPFLGKTTFGLGWFLVTGDPAHKLVLHTGKQGGIVTIFVRDITKRQTFILLDNSGSDGLNNLTLNTIRILDNKPLLILKKSFGFTYAKDIANRGIDFAVSHFNQLKSDTLHYYYHRFEFDYVGHQLIETGKKGGMETLRLLTQITPDDWFPYCSYGKALLQLELNNEASMALTKSLSLSPGNEEVMKALEQLKTK